MEKSWWWKSALYGAVTLLSVLYLVPTIDTNDAAPSFIRNTFNKKLRKGLDLQGGLHLVYEVNVDKAVSSKVDRISGLIEDRLNTAGVKDLSVSREGRDDIVVTFATAADNAKLDGELLAESRDDLDEVSRDEAAGVVRYRLDPDQVDEINEYALRQAIETIRGRVDKYGVAEPTIIRKGTDIVVELPGLGESEFERIKSIIGRTAQLEFKLVDTDSDYMKRVAASVEKGGEITVDVDIRTHQKTGARFNRIFLQADERETLEKFVAGLTGDLAVPGDREFGYQEIQKTAEVDEDDGPETAWRTLLLHRRAAVTGDYLADAQVGFDETTMQPNVYFTLDREGGNLMGNLTGQNIGRQMAIVLDENVNSAPVINGQIRERGMIELGGFRAPSVAAQEAKDLVAVLRSGALPAPLTKTFETQVGPTLGADTVSKAQTAILIGGVAVVLFMVVYYRVAGLIAVLAMLLNLVFIGAILAAFEAALTLPGIAGLVLTVGMAVDANIIIYERIREELRSGKSARSAVDAGYGRAFWTVFDANVTNFVAGVVLYSYGSGPIKGFALTLLIGIITNLFTAVLLSRWAFDYLVNRRGSKFAFKFMEVIKPGINFDFVGRKRVWISISVVLVAASLLMLPVNAFMGGRGSILNWGVDFRGGSEIVVELSSKKDATEMRAALAAGGLKDADVVRYGDPSKAGLSYMIRTGQVSTLAADTVKSVEAAMAKVGDAALKKFEWTDGSDKVYLTFDKSVEPTAIGTQMATAGAKASQVQSFGRAEDNTYEAIMGSLADTVRAALDGKFGAGAVAKIPQVESVGAKAGRQLQVSGFQALLAAILLIVVYVALRFDLRFGPGTIIALLHDALITVGVFAVTYREFSLTTLAAVLTIIGFSVNDTIVVFDRVRENSQKFRDRKFELIVNQSINETLGRTIWTSATLLFVTLAMNVWGVGVVRDFAFAMNVGVIVGTYSSIFIASPTLIWLNRRFTEAQRKHPTRAEKHARSRGAARA